MKHFYTHLVEIESINLELDKIGLSQEEKIHLANLVDSSLHHTILNAIFAELSDDDKRVFAVHLNKDDHDKIWQFLNEKVTGIENKIKQAADGLKKELHKDIKQAI